VLNWRNITPVGNPKFWVRGTELNNALCGPQSRYQICEIRVYDKDRNADRAYTVRDAATVTDEEVKQGIRPKIVANFDDDLQAIAFCMRDVK
jgi:hypothetical protein